MDEQFASRDHARDAQARLDGAGPQASLHEVFAGCSDELWYWVLTDGRRINPAIARRLPRLPDPDIQSRFTALSGDETFRQAADSVAVFREAARQHGLDFNTADLRLLDFGCGWGRITQVLLRDAEASNITGVDIQQEAIDICIETGLDCDFALVEAWPPTALPDGAYDMIVAYSVFSHLSEENHIAWVEELAAKLKPGGIFTATTRPRSFITMVAELRDREDLPVHARGAAASFLDTDAWLDRYDRGEFCFDIAGSGGKELVGFYGEAVVPQSFVTKAWGKFFSTVGMITTQEHGAFDQNVIYAKK